MLLALALTAQVRGLKRRERAARKSTEMAGLSSDGPRAQHPLIDVTWCIGCGACVAACKNASAHLFMSAKISQLSLLPQGQVEQSKRVVSMIAQADAEGFGSCSNEGECEAVCPKEIPISNIARMSREYTRALLAGT